MAELTRNIVVIGATSRLAGLCARHWATQGAHLLLAGRDRAKLEALAQDLRARGAPYADWVVYEAEAPYAPHTMVQDAQTKLGRVDIVLIAHGWLPDQYLCEIDHDLARKALDINGTSACMMAEGFADLLAAQNHGSLAVIGSVAGDRGRQSNYIYGAAKALVEHYLQGLRNRLHSHGVSVTLIKPGPTDTPMTAELKRMGLRLTPAPQVAHDIVHGIAQRRAVVYTPGRWRWIMAIIRAIPEALFVRLKL